MRPCFRNTLRLPPLTDLANQLGLEKRYRIRARKRTREGSLQLKVVLANERKVERKLRSKSGLDDLFELAPMAPWRQTLKLIQPPGKTILHLDFKNFYPTLLCSQPFPHPARLHALKTNTLPEAPGLLRARLHLRSSTPEALRQIHPFQLQEGPASCPFQIDENPIETLLHTGEIPVWNQWLDIEPLEAILSEVAIDHPLKYRTIQALEKLEKLRETDPKNPDIPGLKVIINSASATPKINSPRFEASPYGVHCLSSQIPALGRALLCQTIMHALEIADTEILLINTDGFLAATPAPERLLSHLAALGILGQNPGQLREKSRSDRAFLLGTNAWWAFRGGEIADSAGSPHCNGIPSHYHYTFRNKAYKIPLLALADWRHHLDKTKLTRSKFILAEDAKPASTVLQEKRTSFKTTKDLFRKIRAEFPNTPTNFQPERHQNTNP